MLDFIVILGVGGAAIWIQCLRDEVKALRKRLPPVEPVAEPEGGGAE